MNFFLGGGGAGAGAGIGLSPQFVTKQKGNKLKVFLISNFRRVPNVVSFLLGNSPASEFCMPTFRNTLSFPSS